MNERTTAFERFASTILQVYHRDKDAFWATVMAPFLADKVSRVASFQHLKVDLKLLSAFHGLDAEARLTLKDFSEPLGFEVTRWKSNRMQYFKELKV